MTAARAHRRQGRRRAAAVAALLLGPLAIASAAEFVGEDPWQAVSMLLSLALALAAGWFGLVRRGVTRIVAVALAAFLAAGVVETLVDTRVVDRTIIVGMAWGSIAAAGRPSRSTCLCRRRRRPGGPCCSSTRARAAARRPATGSTRRPARGASSPSSSRRATSWRRSRRPRSNAARTRSRWPAATARRRWSPRSRRATACRTPASRRGRATTSRSTSGSTATTSSAPSTRSSTGASVVDLAEVNGRVFVNNVSLGLYATALQRDGYRAAKLRTVLRTLPDVAGPGSAARDLEYGHADGRPPQGGMILLVSNNRYRLGGVMGSGTRPRIDDGRLGVAVVRSRRKRRAPSPRQWHEWDAREFEVRSSAGVPAGIDGEAAVLAAPLRFKSLPGALRVRVAASHPGASPSAAQPDSVRQGIRSLVAIAAGRGAP